MESREPTQLVPPILSLRDEREHQYMQNEADAISVVNDGFVKVFKTLKELIEVSHSNLGLGE